jgi:hypothetical protein
MPRQAPQVGLVTQKTGLHEDRRSAFRQGLAKDWGVAGETMARTDSGRCAAVQHLCGDRRSLMRPLVQEPM